MKFPLLPIFAAVSFGIAVLLGLTGPGFTSSQGPGPETDLGQPVGKPEFYYQTEIILQEKSVVQEGLDQPGKIRQIKVGFRTEVRNESDIDFYVRGKGLTPFVHVGLETRASDKEEWQRIRAFHCGTGEEEHLIGPGESFLAFDELPSEAVGGEYRIRFGGRFISAGQTIVETFYSPAQKVSDKG